MAVVAGVGMWAERQGQWISIHLTGPCRTTVTNNPDSERYHRTLFRDLRRTLMHEGCWQFGPEGKETEVKTGLKLNFEPIPIRGEPLSATIIADRGED